MDFEINFIEGILKRKPDFIEALIALGDLYTKRGFFEKGLEVDLKLAQLRPDDPYILYNLACSYSLVNNIDAALQVIKRSVDFGYDHLEGIEQDHDLSNLHKDDRYQEFISDLLKKKNPAPQDSV